jgi:lysozyme
MLILVACTRERPTPEPTATTAIQQDPPPATAAIQAQVITTTSPVDSGAGSEEGIVITNTPNALTPDPALTPTPPTPETFPYVVQPGDTLSIIAERFQTDIETLRRLNNLDNDNLAVGQPIYVPFVEGVTAEGVPTPTPGPFLYTIQIGDTLTGLAVRFGVDPIAIQEANAETLLDPNNLTIGSTILIPGYQPPAQASDTAGEGEEATTPEATEGEPVVHVVTAGQGLIEIATLYGVTVVELAAANGMSVDDILRIGQELIIPGITQRDFAIAQGNTHTVQPGENLLSIALDYGVTVEELQAANELDNPDSIFIGQVLIIPAQ